VYVLVPDRGIDINILRVLQATGTPAVHDSLQDVVLAETEVRGALQQLRDMEVHGAVFVPFELQRRKGRMPPSGVLDVPGISGARK
jgi:hypothetical protein